MKLEWQFLLLVFRNFPLRGKTLSSLGCGAQGTSSAGETGLPIKTGCRKKLTTPFLQSYTPPAPARPSRGGLVNLSQANSWWKEGR